MSQQNKATTGEEIRASESADSEAQQRALNPSIQNTKFRSLNAGIHEGPNVDIQVELITPALAKAWLANKAINRKLSQSTIDKYARAMKAGDWELNGEAVKFDNHGILIDGQHRLSAVVRAGVEVRTVVVRGLNGRSFETFDSGKGRSIPDVLSIYGYKDFIVLASVARTAYLHKTTGSPLGLGIGRDLVQPKMIVTFLKDDAAREQRLVEAAREGMKRSIRGTFWNPSNAAYLWFVTHLSDAAAADEFFGAFARTEREDHPVQQLGSRIAKDRLGRSVMSREEALALCFKSWNAFVQQQPITSLRYRMFGDKAEKLPDVFGLNLEAI